MADAKFTPGPWVVAPSGYRVMSANREIDGVTQYGTYICDTANNAATRIPENAANARLIAASPEMHELLRGFAYLVTPVTTTEGFRMMQQRAQEILARVEGRQ